MSQRLFLLLSNYCSSLSLSLSLWLLLSQIKMNMKPSCPMNILISTCLDNKIVIGELPSNWLYIYKIINDSPTPTQVLCRLDRERDREHMRDWCDESRRRKVCIKCLGEMNWLWVEVSIYKLAVSLGLEGDNNLSLL